jgi:hypothetical protein
MRLNLATSSVLYSRVPPEVRTRVEQTSLLVCTKVLDARSDQIGGDGDCRTPPGNLTVDLSRRCGPDQSCRSPVLRHNSVLTY